MDELAKKLSTLEIHVSEGSDGKITAYTTQEPLFCFVRDDLDAIKGLVHETLESYVKTFFKAHSVKIETVEHDLPKPIPVTRLKPTKHLVFKEPISTQELACA